MLGHLCGRCVATPTLALSQAQLATFDPPIIVKLCLFVASREGVDWKVLEHNFTLSPRVSDLLELIPKESVVSVEHPSGRREQDSCCSYSISRRSDPDPLVTRSRIRCVLSVCLFFLCIF